MAIGAYVLLYLSWQALHWGAWSQELAGGILGMPLSIAATYAAWRASRRAAGSARLRQAWWLIALALAFQTAGGIAQLVYEQVLRASVYPSIADVLYLSFYPLLLAGILRLPTPRRGPVQTLELLLDSAIVALGGGAVFVYFIVTPTVLAGSAPLATVTSVAYPVGDMILLVALGTALLRGSTHDTRASLRAMTVAMGLFIVADLIYGYLVLHNAYEAGGPLETMYMLAFACFTIAALAQRPVLRTAQPTPVADARSQALATTDPSTPATNPPATQSPSATSFPGVRVSWVPYLAIAASLAMVLASDSDGRIFPDIGIATIAALVSALVIARQILAQVSLRQSRAHLAHAQALAHLVSWGWDLGRNRLEYSEEELRLFGLNDTRTDEDPLTYKDFLQAVHPEDRDRVRQTVRSALAGTDPFVYEMRVVLPDGQVRTLIGRGEVHTHAGRVVGLRGTHQDITERKRMERQIRHQADHDPLTGLYNRRRFAEELNRALRYASRYHRTGAVVMLDIDDFKLINDAHGHAAGDRALQALSQTIAERTRQTDILARLGGDELVMVLPETDEHDAIAVTEDIRDHLAARQLDPPIRVSAGIAMFDGAGPGHGPAATEDEVLVAADIALYEAKDAGKNQIRVHRDGTSVAVTCVQRIRTALAEERFVLHSQPMINVRTSETAYNELLIRMVPDNARTSDDGRLIPPAQFIPIAERFGLINDIDRWVVREGLRLAREGEPVSINLSAHSICDPDILEMVRESTAYGMDPANAIFELTETAAVTNIAQARTFAQALADLGCDLALDDFGTGFGSFNYLKHLPARYLKIDMEFVRDITTNTTDQQVVLAIANIAHSLGKLTIAEGVEDEATLAILRDYGVDLAQGHYIAPPGRAACARPPVAPPPVRCESIRRRSSAGRAPVL